MLHGHALKVRRPVDYLPAPAIDLMGGKPALPTGAIVATNVPDSPYKVCVNYALVSKHFLTIKDIHWRTACQPGRKSSQRTVANIWVA